jgi:hypothetical protein
VSIKPVRSNSTDPAWTEAVRITVPINGGWADAREVTIGAAHDGEYAYRAADQLARIAAFSAPMEGQCSERPSRALDQGE